MASGPCRRQLQRPQQWRSPATRYDKLALTYRSAAVLQAVVIWSAAVVFGRHALALEVAGRHIADARHAVGERVALQHRTLR
jgi:hypothetical protein